MPRSGWMRIDIGRIGVGLLVAEILVVFGRISGRENLFRRVKVGGSIVKVRRV